MAYKITGQNGSVQYVQDWETARTLVNGDIQDRIEMLTSDVANGDVTGTEEASLHALASGLVHLAVLTEGFDQARLSGDGFDYIVEPIEDADVPQPDVEVPNAPSPEPSDPSVCGFAADGQTCIKAPGHELPHRLMAPTS